MVFYFCSAFITKINMYSFFRLLIMFFLFLTFLYILYYILYTHIYVWYIYIYIQVYIVCTIIVKDKYRVCSYMMMRYSIKKKLCCNIKIYIVKWMNSIDFYAGILDRASQSRLKVIFKFYIIHTLIMRSVENIYFYMATK